MDEKMRVLILYFRQVYITLPSQLRLCSARHYDLNLHRWA
jgi:hypothetical protein